MDRRAFLAGAGAVLLAAPLAAEAQEQKAGKVYRIGFLRAGQPPKLWVEAFQQGLRERGYVDGQNVVVEFRFTEGSFDQLPRLAEELRLKIDVIEQPDTAQGGGGRSAHARPAASAGASPGPERLRRCIQGCARCQRPAPAR
jgi:putative tryptophan/tyrosine transport system substrate-binding protein